MRSLFPMPGNPWPHDMMIRVDDDAQPLLELLWIREAYELRLTGDLPPLLCDRPDAGLEPTDRGRWEQRWPLLWDAVLQHIATLEPEPLMDELDRTSPGSPERARLLERLAGPSVHDEFGVDAAIGFESWREQNRAASDALRDRMLRESPEHRAVKHLVPAWRAGLTQIITIPCRGDHTRSVGPRALLITDETRADPRRFAGALDLFLS
ncbi:MAG: hypothetical protein LBU78_07430 [Microbacterium sp.]|jgi:hypothetical protein|nr:hypothetical protein [Microbacterium sp.]